MGMMKDLNVELWWQYAQAANSAKAGWAGETPQFFSGGSTGGSMRRFPQGIMGRIVSVVVWICFAKC